MNDTKCSNFNIKALQTSLRLPGWLQPLLDHSQCCSAPYLPGYQTSSMFNTASIYNSCMNHGRNMS